MKAGLKEAFKEGLPGFRATRIVNATGSVFAVDPRGIRSGLVSKNAIVARQVATYLIREDVGQSFPWIGRFLGRHHSTVIHCCEVMERAIKTDEALAEKIEAVRHLYPDMPGDTLLTLGRLRISTARVLDTVASLFDIRPEMILKKWNSHLVVLPRQIATYLLHETTERSLPEIARIFRQNHTTCLYGYRKIKNAMEGDEKLRDIVLRAQTLCLQDNGSEE
ncbi:MAG: helix-turn-helix domain-containing protein [Candidatus Pacebacteria bacterium]|nr:helix-turn-helix domain-containing protein [Candidatus Paceibacterota bacterium]